jgi:hypothetical protein
MSTPTLCGVPCPDHPHTCARSPQHYSHHRDAKQKGTETCSWPDPPEPRPAGPTVTDTRAAAREALRGLTGGDPAPQWRVVFTDSESPDGIAPVCEDPGHDPTDGNFYDCCPEPDIEVGSEAVAAYMVALLNGDREQPAEAAPDFFQPGRTYTYGGDGFTAPELLTWFRAEHITTHPDTGKRTAFGWARRGDEQWVPYSEPDDDFAAFTLQPEDGAR